MTFKVVDGVMDFLAASERWWHAARRAALCKSGHFTGQIRCGGRQSGRHFGRPGQSSSSRSFTLRPFTLALANRRCTSSAMPASTAT